MTRGRPAPVTGRGELTLAVLLAAAAGALGLFAGARPWFDIRVGRDLPLPPVEATVTGATVSPLVPALALVVLAAAAALLATRTWGRRLVGVLVVLAGAGLVAVTRRWAGDVPGLRIQELVEAAGLPQGRPSADRRDGVWLAAAAGLLAIVVGAFTVWRAGRWPALGRRYDAPTTPAARPASVPDGAAEPSERGLWDALDRGEDPTARG